MIYMAKWQDELDALHVPKTVHKRAVAGVKHARIKRRNVWRKVGACAAAISLLIIVGQQLLTSPTPPTTSQMVMKDGVIHIPAIHIPDDASNADMNGLVVYDGHIYTQSDVTYEGPLRALQGTYIGKTKNLIDEWSSASVYEQQLASNIGEQPIYTVKGYDEDFRVMFYRDVEGEKQVGIFERLNDIKVSTGKDVFEQFNMTGNVVSANWQSHAAWDVSANKKHRVTDVAAMERFVAALHQATPHVRADDEPLSMAQNNETFKALTIRLKDGTAMTFKLLKGGYVYYGFMDVYFEVDEQVFNETWHLLK